MSFTQNYLQAPYERLKRIQARKGQVNCHSVYVKDVEEIELFPRGKSLDHATVHVVKDCVDGLYRYSTGYFIRLGGSSSSPSFYSKITETRTDAVLCAAREVLETLTSGWESKDDPKTYNPLINKIKDFIEKLKAEIRQPSLFA